jgi:iron(III) transport system ATP-binding protein
MKEAGVSQQEGNAMLDKGQDRTEPYLAVEKVTKHFGRFVALKDISFQAGRGEFLCVLGPSGCGKTTILRILAGLELQTSGRVLVQGRDVSNLPVSKRQMGIVFQSYALFPNLTAEANIGYGLKSRGLNRGEIENRIKELIRLVSLEGMGHKYPAQLSGGQQQRVALARAIALSPQLLLLDEPLSALDAKVRVMLRSEIRQLQRQLGVTAIMVTHDQEEALTMADRILVMDHGKLVQDGTPHEIYERPATPFVASFIGSMNFIRDIVKDSYETYRSGGLRLQVEKSDDVPVGSKATIAIRPEEIMIGHEEHGGTNLIPGRVRRVEYRGSQYRVHLLLPLGQAERTVIEADLPAERIRSLSIVENMEIGVHFPPERLRVYAT